ncbi:uncharacterized protein HGUI_02548 [Hanseniaspora guilliermondii]|uniref:MMS19 nucleotide excision repair protein n=1 Tax=Hanseniaspora guilliermondii TaxID=56406 RepID=A0A1L0B3I9_9ASCO|nr:uncharacterized protein HGUI_02548 [Hanseniaspora guilliermondii]
MSFLEHQYSLFKNLFIQKNSNSLNEADDYYDNLMNDITSKLAAFIDEKKYTLLNVVTSIKDDITSVNDENRLCGLEYLSIILSNIKKDTLLSNECNVIFDFFLSKILNNTIDFYCFKQILNSFKIILTFNYLQKSFPGVQHLLQFIQDEYNPNEYVALVRYSIFEILNIIRINGFIQDEALYVNAFLNVANGEKDPRNLMESFKLNKIITSTFNKEVIYSYSQKLFDVLFCYFPITFKPPKNDPYKITSDDLKNALRCAISNCDYFSIDAFPNLIDKLTATSIIVKNETLKTLKDCFLKYHRKSIAKYWQPLWDALKNEVLRGSNDEFDEEYKVNNYKEALSVIKTLFDRLSGYEGENFNFDNDLLKFSFEDVKHNFENNKNIKQSADIFSTISSINISINDKVLRLVLPVFFEPINKSSEMDMESIKLILMNMSLFLKEVAIFQTEMSSHSAITQYKDELLVFLTRNLSSLSDNEIHIKTLSVFQLTYLIKIPAYLTKDEIYMISEIVLSLLNSTIGVNKNIFLSCLDCIKSIVSSNYSDVVKDVILSSLLQNLRTAESNQIFDKNLKTIANITFSCSSLTSYVAAELVDYIQPSSVVDLESCFLVLSTVYTIIDSKLKSATQKDSVNTVVKIRSSVELREIRNELINPETIDSLYEAIFAYDQIFDHDGCLEVISLIFFTYSLVLTPDERVLFCSKYIKPLMEQVFGGSNRLSILFAKIYAALDIENDVLPAELVFKNSLSVVYKTNNETASVVDMNYYMMVALAVNKQKDLISSIENLIEIYKNSNHNIGLMFWLAKGLCLSSHKECKNIITFLLNLLDDNALGDQIAESLQILMVNIPIFRKITFLDTKNLNINSLHQQKVFHLMVPILINKYKETDDELLKSRYLTALSHILKSTSVNIKNNFTQDLFPLLVSALDASASDVVGASLQTICDTFVSQPEVLLSHVDTLIKKTIVLSKVLKNGPKVRALSLQTLLLFVNVVPINILQPYKNTIIKGLVPVLDDPNRSVRKLAVDTRQAYFDLGMAIA